jgi:hypothetical protein
LDRIKELEAENLRLKQSLADEVLDNRLNQAFLRIACRRAGTTVEDLKKKNGGMPPTTPTSGMACQ